jgi:hypothetical protein
MSKVMSYLDRTAWVVALLLGASPVLAIAASAAFV